MMLDWVGMFSVLRDAELATMDVVRASFTSEFDTQKNEVYRLRIDNLDFPFNSALNN